MYVMESRRDHPRYGASDVPGNSSGSGGGGSGGGRGYSRDSRGSHGGGHGGGHCGYGDHGGYDRDFDRHGRDHSRGRGSGDNSSDYRAADRKGSDNYFQSNDRRRSGGDINDNRRSSRDRHDHHSRRDRHSLDSVNHLNGQPPKSFSGRYNNDSRCENRDRQRSHSNRSRNDRDIGSHHPYQRPNKPLIISPGSSNRNNTSNVSSDTQSNTDTTNTPNAGDTNEKFDSFDSFPKLDPNDLTHARRMKQRRRQVLFGKNTAGYDEYVKQVPKHRRKFKSLDHPMTPDHTLDIPTKRWHGLMNAWRRSLHKFDPPDLSSRQPSNNTISLAPRPILTAQDAVQEEIAKAKAAGLQVAFGNMSVAGGGGLFGVRSAGTGQGEGVEGIGGGENVAKMFSVDVAPEPVSPFAPSQISSEPYAPPAMDAMDESIPRGFIAGSNVEEMTMDEEEAYQRTMNHSYGGGVDSSLYDDSGASRVMMMGEHKQNRRSAMVAIVKRRGGDGLSEDGEGIGNDLDGKGDYSFLEEGCDCDSDDDVL